MDLKPRLQLLLFLLAVTPSCKTQDWSLPTNYDVETAHNEVILVCSVHTQSLKSERVVLDTSLSREIQSELAGNGPFKVYYLFGDGSYRLAEDLASRGKLHAPVRTLPRVDLFLTGKLVTTKGKVKTRGGNEQYSYRVTLSVDLVDSNKTLLWNHRFEGRSVSRTATLGVGGRFLGGFNPNSEDDVAKAIMDSGSSIPQKLALALAQEFPVTGAVTGKLGDRLSFNKGSASGLNEATQMLVWYRMKGGLAIPIGKARALPSRRTATLEVYAWNTLDADAKAIIDQLQTHPEWMQDKGGDREGVFATTAGLPIPPRWDPARAQYEDAKKNK